MHPAQTKLSAARLRCHWTQAMVAAKIGTTVNSVSRWERGEVHPTLYYQQLLCDLYALSAEELGFTAAPPSPFLFDPLLPAPSFPAFVGRTTELASGLTVCQPQTITGVSGLPGIGKTTFTVALAHHPLIKERFPAGVLWAGIGPQGDPIRILQRWLTLLGDTDTHWQHDADPVTACSLRVREILHGRPFLIVLDDLWSDADLVPFLQAGASCGLLVTTRSPTLVRSVFPAHHIPLGPLSDTESHVLLTALVPTLAVSARSAVLAVTHGVPLAVMIYGLYLRRQQETGSPRRIQQAIQRVTDTFTRLRIASLVPSTYRVVSLHETLALSVAALSAAARQVYATVAVLPATPDRFREADILAISQQDANAVDEVVDAGLIRLAEDQWYTVHQLVQEDALLHPDAPAKQGHLVAYVAQHYRTHQYQTEQLVADEALFRVAWTAATGQAVDQFAIVDGLMAILFYTGRSRQIFPLLTACQQRLSSTELVIQAHLARRFGEYALMIGDLSGARSSLEMALTTFLAASQPNEAITLLLRLLDSALAQGDFSRCLLLQQQCRTLLQEVQGEPDYPYYEHAFHLHLFMWSTMTGRYRDAITAGLALVHQAQETQQTTQIIRCHGMLIESYLRLGMLSEAEALSTAVAPLLAASQGHFYRPGFLTFAAEIAKLRGDTATAIALIEEAVLLAESMQARFFLADLYALRMRIALDQQELPLARTLGTRLFSLSENDTFMLITTLLLHSELAVASDDLPAALQHLEEAATGSEQFSPPQRAAYLWAAARYALVTGDHALAQSQATDALIAYTHMERVEQYTLAEWMHQQGISD